MYNSIDAKMLKLIFGNDFQKFKVNNKPEEYISISFMKKYIEITM